MTAPQGKTCKERPAMSEAKFLIGIATAVHPDAYEIERQARD